MSPASAQRNLAALVACVFLSGTASLALEVVWSRLLKLVFGSTTLAITTILVAYMLGLGLGGLLGGRLAARVRSGVRTYGLLEAAIGLYALGVPWILGWYPELHRALAGFGFWPAAFVRFAIVSALFLLPTLAMGATLPLLVAALVRERGTLAARVGLLYGINTLGAVAGVLLATFVGFRVLGVHGTNSAAALVDIGVGLVAALWLAPRIATTRPPATQPEVRPAARWRPNLVVLSYGIVGGTALTFEIAWTRGLAMILGSSTYAFATILAGFLSGIALGSLLARRFLDRIARPTEAYARGLFLLGACSLVVGWSFRALPDLFLALFARVGISGATLVWLGLGFAFVVMLAPTIVLGALFPLVTRIASEAGPSSALTRPTHAGDAATAVGSVYFANTLGSAFGAFAAGFLAIPLLGLPRTLSIAIALDFVVAALLFHGCSGRRVASVLVSVLAAAFVLIRPPGWDAEALSSGVYYRTSVQLDFGLPRIPMLGSQGDELLFYREGLNCTVSVHKMADGLAEGGISMRVNGKTDASLADMSTQILSGHLPFLFSASGQRSLVIGYASGITTGAATLHGGTIDVCEIEPAVIEASHFFDDYNHRPLENADVRLIEDDARSYLAGSTQRYGVIISEPSNPWIAGCSSLFTSEFFASAHDSLEPNGRLLQWVQLYGMTPRSLRSVLAAMHESFDYAYGFLFDAYSTDLLILASDREIDMASLPRLEQLSEAIQRDLARIRILSSADLWSLLLLTPQDLAQLASEADVVNTDDSMFVELSAPWALYDDTEETLALVRERASGAPGLLEAAGPAEALLSPDELGELAVSYLIRREEIDLADATHAMLLRAGARAPSDLYRALRAFRTGEGGLAQVRPLLDSAVALAPRSFEARLQHGRLMMDLGQYADALRDLELALELRPGHLEARYEHAKLMAAMGRMQAAYAETSALTETALVETEPRLWAEAAFFSGGFGRFDEAIERMQRYLELEPYAPEQWEQLGLWLERAGREREAQQARANVERASANAVRDLHWVARWHERFGTRREAVIALQEVLRQDPGNQLARADLARIQSDLAQARDGDA